MDTLHRSLTKTVIWRVIASLITLLVTYIFTGQIGQATTITLVVAVVLAAGYYVNERIWDRIEWGRRKEAYATQSEKFPRVRKVVN